MNVISSLVRSKSSRKGTGQEPGSDITQLVFVHAEIVAELVDDGAAHLFAVFRRRRNRPLRCSSGRERWCRVPTRHRRNSASWPERRGTRRAATGVAAASVVDGPIEVRFPAQAGPLPARRDSVCGCETRAAGGRARSSPVGGSVPVAQINRTASRRQRPDQGRTARRFASPLPSASAPARQ